VRIGGHPQSQRLAQLLADRVHRLLRAVEFEAERAEADGVEASLDHLEGGLLLGHEQHGLALGERMRDEVRDGLRLARARRPLEHEGLAARGAHDRGHLRTVGRDRQPQRSLVDDRFGVAACRLDEGLARPLDEMPDHRIRQQ
jgi:hypothetical protein